MSRDTQEKNRWPTRRLGDVLVRHNEVIHPGERTGEATFVGLEHIEPNSGRRIGSLTIDLGSLTGRKPTFRRGQIVYGYLRPYLNKVWVAEFDGYSSVDQFAFDVRPELADTEFVAAFMRSETFLRRSSIVTTTGQLPRIGTEQIAAVPIELPPVDVQRRIAADLAEQLAVADAARRAAEERLAAAEALPVSVSSRRLRTAGVATWTSDYARRACAQTSVTDVARSSDASSRQGLPVLDDAEISTRLDQLLASRRSRRDRLDLTMNAQYRLAGGDMLVQRDDSREARRQVRRRSTTLAGARISNQTYAMSL